MRKPYNVNEQTILISWFLSTAFLLAALAPVSVDRKSQTVDYTAALLMYIVYPISQHAAAKLANARCTMAVPKIRAPILLTVQ